MIITVLQLWRHFCPAFALWFSEFSIKGLAPILVAILLRKLPSSMPCSFRASFPPSISISSSVGCWNLCLAFFFCWLCLVSFLLFWVSFADAPWWCCWDRCSSAVLGRFQSGSRAVRESWVFIWLFCFPEKWADGLTISSAAPVQFQGNCGADSEPFHSWLERKGSRRFPGNGPFPGNGSFSPLFQEMVQETPSLPRLVQLWGSFRAVSRQLQSNFRAILEQF